MINNNKSPLAVQTKDRDDQTEPEEPERLIREGKDVANGEDSAHKLKNKNCTYSSSSRFTCIKVCFSIQSLSEDV